MNNEKKFAGLYIRVSTDNNEEVLGKTNWRDTRILRIISNEIYKGDFVSGKTFNKFSI